MLGEFKVKTQNWEGKSVFHWKSIELKRNVVCVADNHDYMCHIYAKEC